MSAGGCARSGDGESGQATVIPHAERVDFPRLSGPTLDGATLDLVSLKGKVVVVNVWGSWCAPCRHETPDLERGYEAYRDRAVAFVGIDTRDDTNAAKAFLSSSKVQYPSLVDGGSMDLMAKLAGIVPLQGVPSTVIVDRTGKVAWIASRPVDYPTLTTGLDAILAEQRP